MIRALSASEGRRAMALVCALALCVALPGCRATLSDGTTLWKNESEASVRKKLGAPDVVTARTTNIGNVFFKDFQPVERLYYFDKDLAMTFHEGRLKSFRPLRPGEKAEVQQSDAAMQGALSLVPLGSAIEDVLGRLGDPDVVDVEVREGLIYIEAYGGPEQQAQAVTSLTYYFLADSMAVEFRDRRATALVPLDEKNRHYYATQADRARKAHELAERDPPRVGMTAEEAGKRWRSDVVSTELKDGEHLTLPGLDPEARLGQAITRWYCLSRKSVINLGDGRVTSIEPLEGAREAAIRSFWNRSFDEHGSKVPEERLR